MGLVRDLLITMVQRTPIERMLFPGPDRSQQMEKIVEVLDKAPKGPITATAPVQNHPAPAKEQISPEAMLEYQKRQVYGQLWLLQGHLTNGCRIDGEVCDCCVKHVVALEALATETEPMNPDSLWTEIKTFCNSILFKTEVVQVTQGTYTAEYPAMAETIRNFRKRIDVHAAPTTLEEAKGEAAKLAEEEVERQWEATKKKH